MAGQTLSKAQANFKMALWQADAGSMSSSDLYVWLNDSGLPHEVTIRLHELANYTKKIGNKVFDCGKIILIKIIEFVKAHPNLVAGVGIGVALGFAVNYLVSSIPFIGVLLAPLAAALAATFGIVVFGIAGHRLDKRAQGKEVQNGLMGYAEDVVEIVQAFFQLMIDVFNVVFQNVITA
ncbi:hypothetical protein [Microcoleus sp. FACHB-68]|uniref:hypothetical protein n=1 Tax=Microcoleus sp. FACHB-68 TaxID=2692826 RepID=UPI0016855514|nr:hypothetical protein [Microcoleus sp. FACHB-68]MBD1940554.1 hypothetical protein [Microcoleus sp. FACHB-68]